MFWFEDKSYNTLYQNPSYTLFKEKLATICPYELHRRRLCSYEEIIL